MLSEEVTQNLPSDKLSTTATSDQTIFLLFWSLKKGLLLSYNFLKVFPHYLPYYFFKLSVFVDLHNKLIENISKLFNFFLKGLYFLESNQIFYQIECFWLAYFVFFSLHSTFMKQKYMQTQQYFLKTSKGKLQPSFLLYLTHRNVSLHTSAK